MTYIQPPIDIRLAVWSIDYVLKLEISQTQDVENIYMAGKKPPLLHKLSVLYLFNKKHQIDCIHKPIASTGCFLQSFTLPETSSSPHENQWLER